MFELIKLFRVLEIKPSINIHKDGNTSNNIQKSNVFLKHIATYVPLIEMLSKTLNLISQLLFDNCKDNWINENQLKLTTQNGNFNTTKMYIFVYTLLKPFMVYFGRGDGSTDDIR